MLQKNILEPNRPQVPIWRMRFTCWIAKAANTPSEYVKTYCFYTAAVDSRTRLGFTFIRTFPGLFRIWLRTLWNSYSEFGPSFPVIRTSYLFSARCEVLTAVVLSSGTWCCMLCRSATFQIFVLLSLVLRNCEKLVLLDPENEGATILWHIGNSTQVTASYPRVFNLFPVLIAACLNSVSLRR